MAIMTLLEAIRSALDYELGRDPNVLVFGEDVGFNGGVFRVTEGLQKKYGEKRVFDTPLAESAIVGISIGMSINGLKPIGEIQFDGFTYPAFDQLISHASRMRTRSRGKFNCPLVVRAPYAGGVHAPEHHSESPEVFYAHVPGLKVVVPSTPADAKGLLLSAIRDPDPVIFFEPKKLYRTAKGEVPDGDYTVPIGKARLVKEGKDMSIITWGVMVSVCEEAARQLAQTGVDVEIIDLRTIAPYDVATVLATAQKTGRVMIVHEAPRTCGFSTEIAAQISEKALYYLKAPILRVTGYDTLMPLYKMENFYLPNIEKILFTAKKLMEH
ncbi:alpha-ketoacid dehydrogenase subunit beta [Candidatus Woesearchaeota archaeon]|nr:alpha-ketoacid dehydrogenase subunit beta [Candidatus Woesearchaeota archaeon]